MMLGMVLAIMIVMVLVSSALGLEARAYQMREDFGSERLYDCVLNYYYYIPCPTYSWFWAWTGWEPGEIIGVFFAIGDIGTFGYEPCCPIGCHQLEQFRVIDFAGYGTSYPGLFTVEFDVYCSDEHGCPVGPAL